MIRILHLGSSSVCMELQGDSPYYAPEEYTVSMGGRHVLRGNTNVFSLFELTPDTEYTAEVEYQGCKEEVVFKTKSETCCVSVKDFGAVGDGVHEDTAAIQAAVNFVPEGGRVYFPAGTYLSLPIALRSHITLELSEKAVLLGSPDRERYPILSEVAKDPFTGRETPLSSFEGNEVPAYMSLLHGAYARDITIVGRGRIDGNGQGGDWWKEFENFPAMRPRVVFLNRCEDVTFHGVTVANGPSWHMHPFFSKNIGLYDLYIEAPKDSPNTDAIDPESCDQVEIIGCRFSVGDDCIAIKSNKIEMARKYCTPADHHTIRNCLMDFGHGALTLGSELAGGIRNVSVTKCLFHATDRGLRIKTRRGRGKDSIITNVLFDNIRMDGVLTPIVINMWYNCCDPDRFTEYVWSREHLPVDDRTPHLGTFCFRNMVCTDAEAAACYIDGLPESPIDKVVLENLSISFAENAKPHVPAMQNFAKERCKLGLYLDNVKEIEIRGVKMKGQVGEMVVADHYDKITTEGFEQV